MRRTRFLTAAALLCACSTPELEKAPPSPEIRTKSAAAALCYNLEYGFTCVPPRGFLVTSEAPGPGKIMTLVKRSRTTADQPNLTLSAYPLRTDKLKWLIDERVLGPIEKAAGVQGLESRKVRLGNRDGWGIRFERRYASGLFRRNIFCFEKDGTAFIVDHTAPVPEGAQGQGPSSPQGAVDPSPPGMPSEEDNALSSFVSSLAFR